MLKSALIAIAVLGTTPLLAADPAAPIGNKVTTTVRGQCPQVATRIRSEVPGRCIQTGSSVRVYTQEDVERTGAMNIAEALRRLDPIFF
jgi:outer membrane cobalamin receptor